MQRLNQRGMTAILLAMVIQSFSASFVTASDKVHQIDSLISVYEEYGQFTGTVLVAESGQVIFKKGYGLANREWNIPNEPNTKFRIGSITKQFTAMLIMQLVEEGKIKLGDKLTDYLPDYRRDIGDKVTIHHLLTHTSGIPSYTEEPDFFPDVSRDPYGVDEFVQLFCSGDLQFEPGSQFRYNNSGYFLLGAIIEKITGKTYETVLQERILQPLNMTGTGYDRHAPLIPNRASGYSRTFDRYVNAEYLDMSLPYAAGSMYATVEDLYLWDQALYTEKLLSKKYKEIMFKPHFPAMGGHYAYGWTIRYLPVGTTADSVLTVSHGGGINGFNTLILRVVQPKHLIVLFNNTPGANLGAMAQGIINILYGQPFDLPKKSIARALYDVILQEGIESAIETYHELKTHQEEAYDYREGELNSLGYQLLGSEQIDEAVAILKLNAELFPESFNVYDSLGEAYMQKGDKELAIKNYAKSLDINPNNTNAIRMLNRMIEEE
jgi:CubicO group peptidase (beta-lactamase class C family)